MCKAANIEAGSMSAHCSQVAGHPRTVAYQPVAPNSTEARESRSCFNSGHAAIREDEYSEWCGEWA